MATAIKTAVPASIPAGTRVYISGANTAKKPKATAANPPAIAAAVIVDDGLFIVNPLIAQ